VPSTRRRPRPGSRRPGEAGAKVAWQGASGLFLREAEDGQVEVHLAAAPTECAGPGALGIKRPNRRAAIDQPDTDGIGSTRTVMAASECRHCLGRPPVLTRHGDGVGCRGDQPHAACLIANT
jgi:hypothetical protein